MSFDTQQALLHIKGMARTLREEAKEARTKGTLIEPIALDHYAAMLNKSRDTLEFEYAQSLTTDDSVWLKTVMKSLARCVADAEKTGTMISAGEIKAVIEVVNDAKKQGGAQ